MPTDLTNLGDPVTGDIIALDIKRGTQPISLTLIFGRVSAGRTGKAARETDAAFFNVPKF